MADDIIPLFIIVGLSKDVEYRLAQSGDASCNGLESAEVGSRIMTLKKSGPLEHCDFPKWFKEPKHWHSLNGEVAFNVHQKYVYLMFYFPFNPFKVFNHTTKQLNIKHKAHIYKENKFLNFFFIILI